MSDKKRVEELEPALRSARRALASYAREDNWAEDTWGLVCIFNLNYGEPAKKARNAVKRIDKALS